MSFPFEQLGCARACTPTIAISISAAARANEENEENENDSRSRDLILSLNAKSCLEKKERSQLMIVTTLMNGVKP